MLKGGFRLVTNIQASSTGNKTHLNIESCPSGAGWEARRQKKRNTHQLDGALEQDPDDWGRQQKGGVELWIWNIRGTTSHTLVWDSGQKPNLLAWTRVGWGVECIPGIILFHRYYPSTQRSGLQSSWWLETCLTLRTVHGSCRCGWKPAADRSEKAVTVPSSSGPIQTGKPFTGSTSRQELIKRNWIPASPNSSLIKIVYISVWFPLQ